MVIIYLNFDGRVIRLFASQFIAIVLESEKNFDEAHCYLNMYEQGHYILEIEEKKKGYFNDNILPKLRDIDRNLLVK